MASPFKSHCRQGVCIICTDFRITCAKSDGSSAFLSVPSQNVTVTGAKLRVCTTASGGDPAHASDINKNTHHLPISSSSREDDTGLPWQAPPTTAHRMAKQTSTTTHSRPLKKKKVVFKGDEKRFLLSEGNEEISRHCGCQARSGLSGSGRKAVLMPASEGLTVRHLSPQQDHPRVLRNQRPD